MTDSRRHRLHPHDFCTHRSMGDTPTAEGRPSLRISACHVGHQKGDRPTCQKNVKRVSPRPPNGLRPRHPTKTKVVARAIRDAAPQVVRQPLRFHEIRETLNRGLRHINAVDLHIARGRRRGLQHFGAWSTVASVSLSKQFGVGSRQLLLASLALLL